jgi:hypothetical protein
LAEKSAKDIGAGLKNIQNTLGKKPTTLHSYIDYVQNYDECMNMKDALS